MKLHFRMLHFRMSEAESVQYFQFDKDGNMFIFPPGSGCNGEPKLVMPGEQLNFGVSDFQVDEVQETQWSQSNVITNSAPEVVQTESTQFLSQDEKSR